MTFTRSTVVVQTATNAPPADVAAPARVRARPAAWRARDVSASDVAELATALSLPAAVARVLAGRGINTVDAARAYLEPSLRQLPDPLLLAGVDAALERLLFAIKAGETIGVFGDYDVDGVTSTTLLSEFLEALGVTVASTIPDRLIEGYGLSKGGVDRLKAAGASLIVTVDCGVTAHAEVEYAKARGLDVIVIDHHTVPVTLPKAVSVINPHRDDCSRGSEMLCAVGVTFNLALALRRALRDRGFFGTRPEPDLREALDLVALGTVADVVPLIGENRVLVAQGIKLLQAGRRIGLKALLDVADVDGRVTASTLGFQLGPRVNAAGRLGDAMKAVDLLRAKDVGVARGLARKLDQENTARRDLEKQIVAQAIAQVEASAELSASPVLVVGDERWHPGVVGIVASRLTDRFGKPAVVVGEGGRGSGRSIERFHLHEALVAVAGHEDRAGLEGFGGHAHAAGVRLERGGLEKFRRAMIEEGTRRLTDEDLHKVYLHDGVISAGDVGDALVRRLSEAAPFGRKNPEPTFKLEGVRATAVKVLNGGHLKAQVEGTRGLEMIAFGLEGAQETFAGPMDLLAVPETHTFRGTTSLRLRIKDARPSGQGAADGPREEP